MRFSGYSLRTAILAHLILLIVAAMLLINVVMLKFTERDMIKVTLEKGKLLVAALQREAFHRIEAGENSETWSSSTSGYSEVASRLLAQSGFSELLITTREGKKVFALGSWAEDAREALALSRQTLASQKESYEFSGSTWGIVWLAPERVKISAPLAARIGLEGVVTVEASLLPLYRDLRKSEKFILLYLLMNTAVLVLFGIYLLSRTIVRPIHSILRLTEEFKEGESFPLLPETSRNEIGELSRSLNMMLDRLEENKKELKGHISSLERANKELKKAQEEIVRSEKLASVGRLATGIAHEIGNPIGIVLGYLDLLTKMDLSGEERQDLLARIQSEVTRISQIIRQLLDFSRPTHGEKSKTSVHQLICEMVQMLGPQPMTSHIGIQTFLKARMDRVWADPNQLKQVFLNIMMNAADAMGNGGVSGQRDDGNLLKIRTENTAGMIVLRFQDSGHGIPEKELARIFDPFYTTKEPGKGTGLGLSVCYRIVEGLGGKIYAESLPGQGTTIFVELPLMDHGK